MPAKIIIARMRDKITSGVIVNTTSQSEASWERDLSPFHLGPCHLYGPCTAENMENAWQYSKVYKDHLTEDGEISNAYWDWAFEGWRNPLAVRYPRGKGAKYGRYGSTGSGPQEDRSAS